MIPLVIVAAIISAAVWAAITLEPHMESQATRKRLQRVYRASARTSNTDNAGPEPQATSPNVDHENEPHQPRVGAGIAVTEMD